MNLEHAIRLPGVAVKSENRFTQIQNICEMGIFRQHKNTTRTVLNP